MKTLTLLAVAALLGACAAPLDGLADEFRAQVGLPSPVAVELTVPCRVTWTGRYRCDFPPHTAPDTFEVVGARGRRFTCERGLAGSYLCAPKMPRPLAGGL